MNHSAILLIASNTNLRRSLLPILEKTHFPVMDAAYLCPQELQFQNNTYALFVYAIHSTRDAELAGHYLQDETCMTTPIVFLCEPVFVPILRQASRSCCRVEILITPLEPEQIIITVNNILKPLAKIV